MFFKSFYFVSLGRIVLFLKQKKKVSCGESLIEVIIAIFVVAIGASVATSLIISSVQSNTFSRDNLIALHLAEEGLEALRSIRDTNWLKHGYDKENCWDLLPEQPCTSSPPANSKLSNGSYIVELDDTYLWQLFIQNSALDLENSAVNNAPYQLKVVNRDGAFFYTHNSLPPPYTEETDNPQNGRFYRMIEISDLTETSMNIRSIVQWRAQGQVFSISLESKLTNYQKVRR